MAAGGRALAMPLRDKATPSPRVTKMRFAISPLIGFMLFAGAPALAAPEAGDTFGDWAVECERAPDGEEQCFLSQTQLVKENNARLLKASIGYLGPEQEAVLVLVLPLGVDLKEGIVISVDERPQIALRYQQCLQDGCSGVLRPDEDALAALRDAKRIQVGIVPFGSGQRVAVGISPTGLANGLAAIR